MRHGGAESSLRGPWVYGETQASSALRCHNNCHNPLRFWDLGALRFRVFGASEISFQNLG